jgi:hypothetical protein
MMGSNCRERSTTWISEDQTLERYTFNPGTRQISVVWDEVGRLGTVNIKKKHLERVEFEEEVSYSSEGERVPTEGGVPVKTPGWQTMEGRK